jgi:hypothetical protein
MDMNDTFTGRDVSIPDLMTVAEEVVGLYEKMKPKVVMQWVMFAVSVMAVLNKHGIHLIKAQ